MRRLCLLLVLAVVTGGCAATDEDPSSGNLISLVPVSYETATQSERCEGGILFELTVENTADSARDASGTFRLQDASDGTSLDSSSFAAEVAAGSEHVLAECLNPGEGDDTPRDCLVVWEGEERPPWRSDPFDCRDGTGDEETMHRL